MVGVVYDPYRDEMFSAIRGHGAYMNDKPIHVAEQDCLQYVCLGPPPSPPGTRFLPLEPTTRPTSDTAC